MPFVKAYSLVTAITVACTVSIHHQHIQPLGIEVFQIVIIGSAEITKGVR